MTDKKRNRISTYRLISEAIDYFINNGFTEAYILDMWSDRIRSAFISEFSFNHYVNKFLDKKYKQAVDNAGILKYQENPGITSFSLERIKPAFRKELDRRIVASANLVRLAREETIALILRRFEGFVSSIPVDGIPKVGIRAIKQNIYEPLKADSYAQRRVAIDQGHKLIANINDIVAMQYGAIAVRWHSKWMTPGYNYRLIHKHRHDRIYIIKGSYADNEGLLKPVDGYYEDFERPGQWPFCSCTGHFIYFIRQVPDEYLTKKGKDAAKRKSAA